MMVDGGVYSMKGGRQTRTSARPHAPVQLRPSVRQIMLRLERDAWTQTWQRDAA